MCKELDGKFYCPKCKKERQLEEVMIRVTESSSILAVTEDCLDYEHSSTDGGIVDRYQCIFCGYIIKDKDSIINTPGELYNWLLENMYG